MLLGLTCALEAEEHRYTHVAWTQADGLPSGQVRAIAQDQTGFLWLGTDSGLVRFDGMRFETVEEVYGVKLPDQELRAVVASRDGSLWLGFDGPGWVARLRDGRLETHHEPGGRPALIRTMLEDRHGTIWVADSFGLAKFHDGQWERLVEDRAPAEPMYALFEDDTGTLWTGGLLGVFKRRTGTDIFERSRVGPSYTYSLAQDSNGRMWAADPQHGFGILGESAWQPQIRGFPGMRLMRDRRGTMWITSLVHGIARVTSSEQWHIERVSAPAELTSNTVPAIFEDRDGNVWVGTSTGLDRFSEKYIDTITDSNGIVNAIVRSIARTTDGSIWIATDGGISRFSQNGRTWYDERHGLPGTFVNYMYGDQDVLWVGTTRGLARFSEGRFSPLQYDENSRLRQIRAITKDRDDSVWVSDRDKGIFRWANGQMTRLDIANFALVALTDRGGRVWLGFANGELAVQRNGKLVWYGPRDGLNATDILAIYEDRTGTIWIGHKNGLSRLGVDGRFTAIDLGTGIPATAVWGIANEQGSLWLAVDEGILRIPETEFDKKSADETYRIRYTTYDESDGLEARPGWLRGSTIIRATDGKLWFATRRSVVIVDPLAPKQQPRAPQARIAAVHVDGRRIAQGATSDLSRHTEGVVIEFTALSLTSAGTVHFNYMLEGFDSKWIDARSNRQAVYGRLPPGAYRFRLAARNNDGPDAAITADWAFTIQPAFYQTRLFAIGSIASVGLMIWTAWQLRVRQIRRETSVLLAERGRMARELHDTLLQNLSGLALKCTVIARQLDPSFSQLKEQLEDVRRQVEHDVREARHAISDLRSPTLETSGLAAALRETTADILEDSQSRLEFIVTGVPRRAEPVVEQQLLRIAQEAVRNATAHAQAEVIRVTLDYGGAGIVLRVVDDGCGFDPQQTERKLGRSFGLGNMQERAEQIAAQFNISSRVGAGTQVEVLLALAQ
jgi:signal transduction histidine kinase/ligand-binding sensor domain-containing protein